MSRRELADEINHLHANLCAAISDPTRILILYVLGERPCNVNTLVDDLQIPQPTISRHLKLLRDRGLVLSRREGQYVLYSLADARVIEALDLLRAMLADRLTRNSLLAEKAAENFTLK